MACILLGTIQYNYGLSGFDNSFNARVYNGIYCASTCKRILSLYDKSSFCNI